MPWRWRAESRAPQPVHAFLRAPHLFKGDCARPVIIRQPQHVGERARRDLLAKILEHGRELVRVKGPVLIRVELVKLSTQRWQVAHVNHGPEVAQDRVPLQPELKLRIAVERRKLEELTTTPGDRGKRRR